MLSAYRRHLLSCEHRNKGQHYTLCACPVWVYGILPSGRRVRETLHTNSWERALGRIQVIQSGGNAEDSPAAPSLSTATEAFLADATARSLTKSTLDLYGYLFAHLTTFIGPRSLASIDTALLDKFRQQRTVPSGASIQPGTQRKEIGFLRAFFRWCEERHLCASNPAKLVRLPKETSPGTAPYEPGEITRLIAACDQITSDDVGEVTHIRRRARALVYTLLYSGLRISDVAKLRRDALNVATHHLTIKRIQKTGTPLKVHLHRDAIDALAMLAADNPEYFFWSGRGSLTTLRKNLARTIARLGKIAGVHATAHKFRDSFAVELLTNGADIRTVQMLLGHESVRTTERHYARFVAAHQALLDDAAATLDFERAGKPVVLRKR